MEWREFIEPASPVSDSRNGNRLAGKSFHWATAAGPDKMKDKEGTNGPPGGRAVICVYI